MITIGTNQTPVRAFLKFTPLGAHGDRVILLAKLSRLLEIGALSDEDDVESLKELNQLIQDLTPFIQDLVGANRHFAVRFPKLIAYHFENKNAKTKHQKPSPTDFI